MSRRLIELKDRHDYRALLNSSLDGLSFCEKKKKKKVRIQLIVLQHTKKRSTLIELIHKILTIEIFLFLPFQVSLG